MKVTVVIDVFRAFTTASYVLAQSPVHYVLTPDSTVIARLVTDVAHPIIIGKPEKGMEHLVTYQIPNSPTRAQELSIVGRTVFHRTEAGARGVLQAKDADLILVAGFVNADATIRYIKTLKDPELKIVPMGHEAATPSLEDDLCANYIEACLKGKEFSLGPFLPELRTGPGRYFFSTDQWQYPQKDFDMCLEIGRFDFAIQAEVKDDYAVLTRQSS